MAKLNVYYAPWHSGQRRRAHEIPADAKLKAVPLWEYMSEYLGTAQDTLFLLVALRGAVDVFDQMRQTKNGANGRDLPNLVISHLIGLKGGILKFDDSNIERELVFHLRVKGKTGRLTFSISYEGSPC